MLDMITTQSGPIIVSLSACAAFYAGWKSRGQKPVNIVNSDFNSFIQNINEGYYRASLDGKQIFGNRALARMHGYDNEQQLLDNVRDIATEWYVDPHRRGEFKQVLERQGHVENFISEIYRHKSRERMWISESARMVRDEKGAPAYFEGTIREFSDTMRRLELEDLYKKLSEQAPGALVLMRLSPVKGFSIPYYSNGFEKIMGDVPDEIKTDARTLLKRLNEEDCQAFIDSGKKSAQDLTPWVQQFRVSRSDGSEIWVEINATPELKEDGTCDWHGFLMDITEKKHAEHRIHSLAFYDPLTDLPNRRLLIDRIQQATKNYRDDGKSSALLFIDLDNFKHLNDTGGHGLGDELLFEIAQRLRNCVGNMGLVARFGGDEFVILLDNLETGSAQIMRQAEVLATKVLSAIDAPCLLSSGQFHLSCSIGISITDRSTDHTVELLKQADTAMYEAKAQGKNRFCIFDEKMQEQLENSVNFMNDLRLAIGTDQLKLHYQMQVDAENRIVGAEALLRWDHPEKGAIPPAQFIPAAEETGLVVELTTWLLDEAVKTLKRWESNPNLSQTHLSINISAQQFHEQSFGKKVEEVIKDHDVDPQKLVLEMTEHVVTGDLRVVKDVMAGLKKVGVKFSLDDFGTGYSSLSHLRELPFDELKIDGSFVKDLENNRNDRSILRSILLMAKALDLTTVAEWVETDGQRAFLVDRGCDVMQGYLFGAALPIKAFEEAASLSLFAKQAGTDQEEGRIETRQLHA